MTERQDVSAMLARWIRVIRVRWIAGVVAFAVVFGLGAFLVLTARSVYRAETQLRLEPAPPSTGVNPTGGLLGGLMGLGGDPFASDMELITSRTVAEGVVVDAGLHVTLRAPAGWYRDSLFEHLTADRTTGRASYTLRRNGREVTVLTGADDSVVGRFPVGTAMRFGGVDATLFPARPDAPESIRITTIPFGEAVRATRKRLDVERTRINANLVEMSFDYPDPAVALTTVEAAVRRFLELRTSIHAREAGQTADSLRTVAAATLRELETAERALQDLQERSRLIAPEAQGEVLVERYAGASIDLTRAQLELEAIENVLMAVDTASVPSKSWTTLISYPRFLQNETIAGVLEQMVALEQRSTEVATRRLPGNRERRAVEQQVDELNGTLRSLATAVRDGLLTEVVGLERQVVEMDSVLGALPALTTVLGRHRRDVQMLSEMYALTEQRLRQEELREALTFSNIQMVDPPALRDRPVWPRNKLGLAVAALLAAGTALMSMLAFEQADRSVRYRSDVERLLGVPVLAVLPTDRSGAVLPVERNGFGADAVTLVGLGDQAPARAVAAAFGAGPASGADVVESHHAVLDAPLGGGRSLSAARAAGRPVVLVIEWGRTPLQALERAGALLDRDGDRPDGVFLVYPRPTVPSYVLT